MAISLSKIAQMLPGYGRCYCELKSPILYPWLLKLSVTGATKPHSAVAPVSGSATVDFEATRL